MVLNAIIRVRGVVGVKHGIEKSLEMLNLKRINWMSLVRDDSASVGQLFKVKDFATFGQINSTVLSKVLEKRGMLPGDKHLTEEFLKSKGFKSFEELANALVEGKTDLRNLGLKPFFRLHPPKKGHKRKGIKQPFHVGGALGNRGEKINELVSRMV